MDIVTRPSRRALIVGGAGIAASLALPGSALAATPKLALRRLGVFAPKPANLASVLAYQTWLGRNLHAIIENANETRDWAEICNSLQYLAYNYRGCGKLMVFGIPLLPQWGTASLKRGAAGEYDAYFKRMADTLKKYGHTSCVLRVGWEANGGWMRWCAAADVTSYKAFYRRVVGIFRKVSSGFLFTWDTTLGWKNIRQDTMWPGNDVVDVIGLDIYDEWWNPAHKTDVAKRWNDAYLNGMFNLTWMRSFAKAKGKPLAISEWGLRLPSAQGGHGGGDNPYFISKMAAWLDGQTDLRWSAYFERGDSPLASGKFPKSAAAFKKAFGPLAV